MNNPKNEHYSVLAFVVLNDPLKGKRFPLKDGRNIIGRATNCDIILENPEISRRHAAVTVGVDIEIEDLGSTKGTRQNDRMLVAKEKLLDNDEVDIGSIKMRLEARKRESRRGISFAAACLMVAVAFMAVALILPQETIARGESRAARQKTEGEASWENWSNITLPSPEELRQSNVAVNVDSAWNLYRTGTRLYLDRYSDLRNPSRAIWYYKMALAVATLLPAEDRPAFIHRTVTRVRELQERILEGCEHRAFVTQKHYRMENRGEAMRALNEILLLTQWPDCRYYHWAAEEIKRLQTQTRERTR